MRSYCCLYWDDTGVLLRCHANKSRMVPRTDREETERPLLWLKISHVLPLTQKLFCALARTSLRLRTANSARNPTVPHANSRIGSFPPWCTGFCASSPAWIGSTFASAVLGNPIQKTRYVSISSSSLPPWSRCIFLWNWGCGSPVLYEHGQPRAADVFPARNSVIFEELE